MINTSSGFQTLLSESSRHFLARIIYDGDVLDCDIKNVKMYKGACGDSTLTIGSVYSSYAELTIDGLTTLLENEDIEIQIGMTVSGQPEYITIGKFTVSKIKSSTYESNITAVGFISSKLAVDLPTIQSQTIPNIISGISTATGLTISLSGLTAAGTVTEPLTAMSCRSALELVAFLLGGYATETADGNIKICKYQIPSSTLAVDGDRMLEPPKFADIAFTMTGVKVIVSEESYDEEGTLIPEVSYETTTTVRQIYENKYMTQALFDTFKNNVVGYTYMPAEVGLSLGDPRLEPWDCLSLAGRGSDTYYVPCLQIIHSFDGGLSTDIIAMGAATSDTEIQGTITKQLGQVNSELIKAQDGAAKAVQAAGAAQTAAEAAQTAATNAQTAAGAAQTAAEAAQTAAGQARTEAATAQTMAQQASESANDAKTQAGVANVYASSALSQLSVVQDVVGVLDLLSNKAEYQATADEEVQGGKWYFTREGVSPNYLYHVVDNPQSAYHLTADTSIDSGKIYYTRSGTGEGDDPYVYTEVENPIVSELGTYYEKYYEMVGIDASVKDYVTSRLVVTSDGLTIQDPSMQTKIILSPTDGVVLRGVSGTVIGKYGETAQIGDSAGFHIDIGAWYKLTEDIAIDPNKTYYTKSGEKYIEVENPDVADIGTYYEKMPPELGFYQATRKVAYISNNQLYITQSVVLQQMDLGTPVNDGGLGQWSWKVHANGATPSRNNLNLKWIG